MFAKLSSLYCLILATACLGIACDKDKDEGEDEGETKPAIATGDQPTDGGDAGDDAGTDGATDDAGTDDVTDDADDNAPVEPTLSLTFVDPADLTRNHIVDDEVAVGITFTGDSVECSSDGGATFAACTSDTLFKWEAANKDNEHVVRATLGDLTVEESFTPATAWPAVIMFYHCTQTVSADEDFTTFQARFNDNEVICLDDQVTVYNTNTEAQAGLNIDGSNLIIITRMGQTSQIADTQTAAANPTITVANTFFKLIGVDVSSSSHTVVHANTASTYSFIYASSLTTDTSSFSRAAFRNQSGDSWYIKDSVLLATNGGLGILLPNNGTTIDFTLMNSHVESATTFAFEDDGGHDVSVTGTTFKSQAANELVGIYATGTSSLAFSACRFETTGHRAFFFDNSSANNMAVTISNSIFTVDTGIGGSQGVIYFVGNDATNDGITLTNNTFGRADTAGTNGNIIGTSGTRADFISGTGNTFCRESPTGATFGAIGGGTAQTLFTAGAQANAGAVITCPSGIFN